jgi:hypothetical protein
MKLPSGFGSLLCLLKQLDKMLVDTSLLDCLLTEEQEKEGCGDKDKNDRVLALLEKILTEAGTLFTQVCCFGRVCVRMCMCVC